MNSERAQRMRRKLNERKKRQIVVPRLPKMFGSEGGPDPRLLEVSLMAHKYGEVGVLRDSELYSDNLRGPGRTALESTG